MKRMLSMLLTASLILAGCGSVSQIDQTDPPPVSEPSEAVIDPAPVTPVYTQQQMLAVSVPASTQSVTDGDGNLLFTHAHQTMQLIVQDPEVADKIIIDFLGRIDQTHEQAEQVHQQALTYAPLEVPYTFQLLYSPTRIDQNVLSLYGSSLCYTGGIHPEHNCFAANYNMMTGDVLTLGSILTNADAMEPLFQLILDVLADQKEELQLLGGYEDIVRDWLFSDESYNEDWFFSPTGLCIFFPPYEIAPYSSGIISIEIPYEKLSGIIGDSFFPPETEPAEGQIRAIRRADADLNNFTQIAEVTIDDGGEMFLLYTDTTVYDVRLEAGTWDENGTVFTPAYTAFAARSLTPGDAIMAETHFGDVLPVLRLTYTSGSESLRFFIEQSGKDGSILLTSE